MTAGSIAGAISGTRHGYIDALAQSNSCSMRWDSSVTTLYDPVDGCLVRVLGFGMVSELRAVQMGAQINRDYLSSAPVDVIAFVVDQKSE